MPKLYRRSCDGCGQAYEGRSPFFCGRHCARLAQWAKKKDVTSDITSLESVTSSADVTSQDDVTSCNVPDVTSSSDVTSDLWWCFLCGTHWPERLLAICPLGHEVGFWCELCQTEQPCKHLAAPSTVEGIEAALAELDGETLTPPNITSISDARAKYG